MQQQVLKTVRRFADFLQKQAVPLLAQNLEPETHLHFESEFLLHFLLDLLLYLYKKIKTKIATSKKDKYVFFITQILFYIVFIYRIYLYIFTGDNVYPRS